MYVEGRFKDQVVMITGAARGQGRSHALAFAREGANVVACDIADQIESVPYPLAGTDDLAETERLVNAEDRLCLAAQVDVRDPDGLADVVQRAHDQFGKIDVLSANAGICHFSPALDAPQQEWDDVIGVNLTGVWNTIRAVAPGMVDRGYGRIIATSSSVARHPVPGITPYLVAKTGVVALVKSLSMELFKQGVNVNAVAPFNVATTMILNEACYRAFVPDVENPTEEDAWNAMAALAPYGEPKVEAEDISNGLLFLASDAAKNISGICLDVQAGWNAETSI
jgi:SDR family mycofactocin-dependent oxidoreductase